MFGAFTIFSANSRVGAQSFSVQSAPSDTVIVPPFATTATPHNDIKNLTGSNLVIRWHVIATDFPADWLTSVAFGICDNQLCRNNSSDALWNAGTSSGPAYNSTYYSNSTHDSVGLFDLTLDFSSATSSGTHYVTINLQEFGGSTSKNITFIINKIPTAIPTVSSSVSDVVLYPNPARSELNVVYDASADIKNIAVYNIIGKAMAIYKVSGPSANLNLEQMPAGIYFVQLVNSKGNVVVTKKFTKQ